MKEWRPHTYKHACGNQAYLYKNTDTTSLAELHVKGPCQACSGGSRSNAAAWTAIEVQVSDPSKYTIVQGPEMSHDHKDTTGKDLWNARHIGPDNQNVVAFL